MNDDRDWLDLVQGAYPTAPLPGVRPYRWKLPVGVDDCGHDVDVTLSMYGQIRILAAPDADVTAVMRAMVAWMLAAGGEVSVLADHDSDYVDLDAPHLHLFTSEQAFVAHLDALQALPQPTDGPDVPHLLVVDDNTNPEESPHQWLALWKLVSDEPYVAVTREDQLHAMRELHEHGARIVQGRVHPWQRVRFHGLSSLLWGEPSAPAGAVLKTPRLPNGLPVRLFTLPLGMGARYLRAAARQREEDRR